jgi:putative transposase
MDFVHCQLVMGRPLRVLTVVDAFTRFSPVIDPRFTYRGEDIVQVLERTCRRTKPPNCLTNRDHLSSTKIAHNSSTQ